MKIYIDERYDLAKVAIDNHLTINDFYFARQNLVDQTPGYQERFMQGVFDEDTFYVSLIVNCSF